MIRRLTRLNMVAILIAGLALFSIVRDPASAQTTRLPQGGVTLEGVVASVAMGVGQEFPTFVLTTADGSAVTIITGAYSYLLDNDFEVRVGDRIVSVAFPSLWYDGAYVAIDLKNLSTGKAVTLRDETGNPLWTNGGLAGSGGHGNGFGGQNGTGRGEQGPGPGGGQIGPIMVQELEGNVAGVSMAYGQQYPVFTLALDSGDRVTIMTGPYAYLLEQNFVISVGDRISVKAFQSQFVERTYVAMELTNHTTGVVLALRDEDGRALWITAGPGGLGDGLDWLPPDGIAVAPVTLEGTVANLSLVCGQEFPTIALAMSDGKLVTVITGPYYFLLENGFELRAGDRITARAYLSRWYADTYVTLELTNLTTGKTLLLRDGLGAPVWTRTEQLAERGFGYGGSAAWFWAEAGRTQVFKGKVRSVNPGIGAAYPSLSMMNAQGELITVMLSPNHFMLQNSFAVGVGDRVRVWAFASEGFDRLFTGQKLTNITRGQGITLREPDGQPHWGKP